MRGAVVSNHYGYMLNYLFHFLLTTVFAQSRANFLTNQPSITNTDITDPFPSVSKPPLINLFGRQRTPAEYDPLSTNVATPHDLPNPLGISSLNDLAEKVISALTQLAVPVVIAMVLWGAFLIATSGGNPERLKKGGKTIMWAAVGFGILLLASGVVQIINSLFT